MRFISLCILLLPILSYGQEIDLNGYNKLYYPNGSLQSEGYFVNGKPEGYWKTYYSTGVIKSEGNRKNHLLDSVWIFYNSVGDTLTKINYSIGKKNGFYIEYYTDIHHALGHGRIKSKELYLNDRKEGVSYYYRKDGSLRESANYANNLKEDLSVLYANDGRIVSIRKFRKGNLVEREVMNRYDQQGLKTGLWKEFYEGLSIRTESYYENDLLDGYYKEYDRNGKLVLTLLYRNGKLVEEIDDTDEQVVYKDEFYPDGKLKSTGAYLNDTKVGLHKEYERDGNIKVAKIYNNEGRVVSSGILDKEGYKMGLWENYYKDGKVQSKGNYEMDRREGPWKFYFHNGQIEQEGTFKKGRFNGLWKWYYATGDLWKEEEFYNGKEEGLYSEYSVDGEIIVEGEYFDGEKEGFWKSEINGYIEEGKYVTGLKDGKWKGSYVDGGIFYEGDFIQGNPDGKHKFYHPNGALKEERYYQSGIRIRHWKKYDENGNILITISYQDDKEYRINGVKVDFPLDNVTRIR